MCCFQSPKRVYEEAVVCQSRFADEATKAQTTELTQCSRISKALRGEPAPGAAFALLGRQPFPEQTERALDVHSSALMASCEDQQHRLRGEAG
ncbi:hypothetical protein H920_08172 [Fukomys damarensis]|uniref:Uncharacterized protein n=1 Tax=Fukomys damarensis TaxID=885580 RepID=A0A091E5T7_FUKDA|nr:hypothetical protein H920_08172 [Fukomys damarensis]